MDNLKLRLLTNRLPIMVGDIPVYSPLLLNIAEVGIKKYHEYVHLCTIGVSSLEEKPEDVTDFDVLTVLTLSQEGFYESFKEALFFFTRLDFDVDNDESGLHFFCDKKNGKGEIISRYEINEDNYKTFTERIKFVNCLKDELPDEELDEFDRRVLEMEKAMAEAESKNGDSDIPLKDLISTVCNMDGNGLSILNIWDINIFSFYEQMKRGQLKEGYFLGIKQLLAGADPKEIKLEHYTQKTD